MFFFSCLAVSYDKYALIDARDIYVCVGVCVWVSCL